MILFLQIYVSISHVNISLSVKKKEVSFPWKQLVQFFDWG